MSKCTIKADDFRGTSSKKWRDFLNLCRREKVPVSLGFIGNKIAGGQTPDSGLVRKATRKDVEIWNHGLLHWKDDQTSTTEFCGPSAEDQLHSIQECQRLCQETFGFRPDCFGPPFNAFDVNTLRALSEIPEIRRVYDLPCSPGHTTIPKSLYINCDGADSGRRFNLQRARKQSAAYMVRRSPFVIQIHPGNHWEESCLDKFCTFVRHVKASGYKFVLSDKLLGGRSK